MAKQKPKQKGLRARGTIPVDPWVDDGFGLLERQSLIEVDAPVGRYTVDAVVVAMMQNNAILRIRSELEQIREARIIVDVSGAYAIRHANEEQSASSKFDNAKRTLELLSTMKDAGRAARRSVVEDIAAVIARASDVGPFEDDTDTATESFKFAANASQEILDKVSALTDDLEEFLGRYSVGRRTGSSSEPLTNWFIFHCASGWHGLTGTWPKRDSASIFVASSRPAGLIFGFRTRSINKEISSRSTIILGIGWPSRTPSIALVETDPSKN